MSSPSTLPPVRAGRARLAPLLLLGCDIALYDPNDCAVSKRCEVFQPEGLMCGLTHRTYPGEPGASCEGLVPSSIEEGAPRCPPGMERQSVGDHDAGDIAEMNTCAAVGNADASSAELADVPVGAACGLTNSNWGGSGNLCHGVDPLQGVCPEGFALRYSFDTFYDGEEGGRPTLGAHLIAWCEVSAEGCLLGACPAPIDVVCGLHGASALWAHQDARLLDTVEPAEVSAGLRAAIEADLADGAAEPPSCQGLPEGECPDGMALACVDDGIGDTTGRVDPDALCWCAFEGTTRSRTD